MLALPVLQILCIVGLLLSSHFIDFFLKPESPLRIKSLFPQRPSQEGTLLPGI